MDWGFTQTSNASLFLIFQRTKRRVTLTWFDTENIQTATCWSRGFAHRGSAVAGDTEHNKILLFLDTFLLLWSDVKRPTHSLTIWDTHWHIVPLHRRSSWMMWTPQTWDTSATAHTLTSPPVRPQKQRESRCVKLDQCGAEPPKSAKNRRKKKNHTN